jgi:WD40 repeat protein
MHEDGKVVVWDIEQGEAIGANFGSPGAQSISLAPDGSFLIVGGSDGVRMWDLDTDFWAEQVCFAAGRNLTEDEWEEFFPGLEYQVTCDRWRARPEL